MRTDDVGMQYDRWGAPIGVVKVTEKPRMRWPLRLRAIMRTRLRRRSHSEAPPQ